MESLESYLKLETIERNKALRWIGPKTMAFAPHDWRATGDSKTEFLANRGLPEGEEGDLYVVARDLTRKRILIYYEFNF